MNIKREYKCSSNCIGHCSKECAQRPSCNPEPKKDAVERLVLELPMAKSKVAVVEKIESLLKVLNMNSLCRCFPSNADAAAETYQSSSGEFGDNLVSNIFALSKDKDPLLYLAQRIATGFRLNKSSNFYWDSETHFDKFCALGLGNSCATLIPFFGPYNRHGYALLSSKDESIPLSNRDVMRAQFGLQTAYLHHTRFLEVERLTQRLSTRELEVLNKFANGCSQSTIAKKIDVSVNTVSTYLNRAAHKLGAEDRISAVRKALSLGLVV